MIDPDILPDLPEIRLALAKKDLISYIRYVAPWFIIEEIHILIAHLLNRVLEGTCTRGMINMPPRAGKSQVASKFFPDMVIGNFPDWQILQCCYSASLAMEMGESVRDAIKEDEFKEIFPGVALKKGSSAKDDWKFGKRGIYRSIGITSGAAGKGFNLGIIDDPLSENDAYSTKARENARRWYGSGFYSRRQPEHNVIILMTTRWATDDLQGHMLQLAKEARESNAPYDDYEILSIPAIVDKEAAELLNSVAEECREVNQEIENEKAKKENRLPAVIRKNVFKVGDSFAPRRWPLEQLLLTKGQMSEASWAAVYLQKPVIDGGNILKSTHWKPWKGKEPPDCEYVMQIYDTAFGEGQENDFTARTTWGVFKHECEDGKKRYCCILLEAWQERISFPDLRRKALADYNEYLPDDVIIENKASGQSLIQEFKAADIPVRKQNPKHDKIARAHACSVVLEQGAVYYMKDRDWAQEVIDQCAAFPRAGHDDLVDTCTIAWRRLRDLFWIGLPDDAAHYDIEEDEGGDDPEDSSRGFYG